MGKVTRRARTVSYRVATASRKGIASILFDELTMGLVIRVVSLISKH